MKTTIRKPNTANIQKLGQAIQKGELVAFATETVYGLGADATNTEAVKSIFNAKGRPADNPLIVHLAEKKDLKDYGRITNPLEQQIINELMPGPLTIILENTNKASHLATASGKTIALRIPDHKQAQELIKSSNTAIAAPSANRSGKPSPTSAQAVFDDLDGKIPHILDGGTTPIGIESTVVKVIDKQIAILRPGYITLEDIQQKRPTTKVYYSNKHQEQSPGTRYKHYAPKVPVIISDNITETLSQQKNKKSAVIATSETLQNIEKEQFKSTIRKKRGTQDNLATCASKLFALYHELDKQKIDSIIIEQLTEKGIGYAIMNRVKKSALI